MDRYNTASEKIIQEILSSSERVIGITGTSCIGKSTLTRILKDKLKSTHAVTVIDVDSYLKTQYQGGTKFWNKSSEYLRPDHFDWEELAKDIQILRNGKSVVKQVYIRGIGWGNQVVYEPADYILLEGLFLDSVEASEYMKYDRLVALSAEDEYIYKLRMERDDFYRANYKDFTRTKEETVKEIDSTLRAGKAYRSCLDKWNCTCIFVHQNFWAGIEEDGEYYVYKK